MAKLLDADERRAKELYMELSRKEKIAHFWEYHKNHFYAAIFISVIAGIIYVTWPDPGKQANLRIKFINVEMEGLLETDNYMETDYEAYLGEDNTCQMLFYYSKFSPDDETGAGMNMEDMMLEVATGNLELFIFDEFAMNKLCPTGYVLEWYRDYYIYLRK